MEMEISLQEMVENMSSIQEEDYLTTTLATTGLLYGKLQKATLVMYTFLSLET